MEKPTFGEKFRALLATGRVANLPTVWSNVLVGFWLASSMYGYYTSGETSNFLFRYFLLICTATAASLLYFGGCLLGDWRDYQFDCQNRPNRPLPKGVLKPGSVAFIGFVSLALGLCLGSTATVVSALSVYVDSWATCIRLFTSGEVLEAIQVHEILTTSVLTICILLYAFFHKRSRLLALPLMATCRMLLVVFAVSMAFKHFFSSTSAKSNWSLEFDWFTPWLLIIAGCVGFYTLLLSSVAATESRPGKFGPQKILGICMLLIPLSVYFFIPIITTHSQSLALQQQYFYESDPQVLEASSGHIFTIVILLIYVIWTLMALRALKTSKPAYVSRALAGFCLLDACFVAAFAPGIALLCLVFFGLALLLQKVTPAT